MSLARYRNLYLHKILSSFWVPLKVNHDPIKMQAHLSFFLFLLCHLILYGTLSLKDRSPVFFDAHILFIYVSLCFISSHTLYSFLPASLNLLTGRAILTTSDRNMCLSCGAWLASQELGYLKMENSTLLQLW